MFYNEKFIKGFKWLNDRKNRPGDVFSWTRETVLSYLQFQRDLDVTPVERFKNAEYN